MEKIGGGASTDKHESNNGATGRHRRVPKVARSPEPREHQVGRKLQLVMGKWNRRMEGLAAIHKRKGMENAGVIRSVRLLRAEIESVGHLFCSCREAKENWIRLRQLAFYQNSLFRIKNTLLETIDETLRCRNQGSALVFLAVTTMQARWRDRNNLLFKVRWTQTPLSVVLSQARYEVEASFSDKSNKQKWEAGLKALQEINKLISGEETRLRPTRQAADEEDLSGHFLTIRLE
ncbi:hypothetical protein R1sor_016589 [Riccia sorocarpa]|uniref:Uncharacterized protein n=1 Tax=Riccia sorocarpa TaxID=122646 RepID=A0ABD3HIY9_9MARC